MQQQWTRVLALTAFLGVGLSPAPAQANDLKVARANLFGSGTYTYNGNSRVLDNAFISLDTDKRFRYTFSARGGNITVFTGKWRNLSGNAVSLDVDRGPGGRRSEGSGTLSFLTRNGRLEPGLLRLSGRVRNGRTFSAGFNTNRVTSYVARWEDGGTGGGSGGGSGGWSELFTSRSGSGNIEVRGWGNDSRIRNVSVKLSRDGRAVLDFQGERNWSFEGRWRRISNDRVSLSITSGSSFVRNSSRWSGNGEIRLRNNQIDSISADGRLGVDPFRIRFDDSGSGGGGGITPPDNSLEFRATRNGRGTIELNNRLVDERVRTTVVELYRNGRAIIVTKGQRDARFEGSWRPGANRAVNFSLTSVSGLGISGFTRITGDMIREDNKFSNLRLNGTADGRTLRFSFVGD